MQMSALLLSVSMMLAPVAPGDDIQARILAVRDAGGGTIRLAAGMHVIRRPLNLRELNGVRLVGEGPATRLVFVLTAKHRDAPLIDLTGSRDCEISNLQINVKGDIIPRVGLLLARLNENQSAGRHRFDNLNIKCNCKLANIVSLGSEVNTYTHCTFVNSEPGGANFLTGVENTHGVRSPFGVVNGGSNLCQYFYNTVFATYARAGREVNIVVESGTGYFYVHGGSMSNKSQDRSKRDKGGIAGIQLGGPSARPCYHIHFTGLEAETYGTINAIQVLGPVYGLRLVGNLFQSLESVIYITGVLEDSVIEQNTLDGGLAQYDWKDGPKRAVVTVNNGDMRRCDLDLRWKRLSILEKDKSSRDRGRRPEIAFQFTTDVPGKEAVDNDIRVRSQDSCYFGDKSMRDLNNIILPKSQHHKK